MTTQITNLTHMTETAYHQFIKTNAVIMVNWLKKHNHIKHNSENFQLILDHSESQGWTGGISSSEPGIKLAGKVHYSTHDRYWKIGKWVKQLHLNYKNGKLFNGKVWHEAQRQATHGNYMFVEYTNICNKPHIGTYIAKDSKHILLGLLAHEISHAVTHWDFYHSFRPRGYEGKPHGLYWQRIYALLRIEFVNGYMTEDELRQTEQEPQLAMAANKEQKPVKPMRLTTAFKKAGFTPSKVVWDKKIKANKICALFDGKKSMVALQIQGVGKYQIYDVNVKDFLDEQPLLEVTPKEGQLLLDFLTGDK